MVTERNLKTENDVWEYNLVVSTNIKGSGLGSIFTEASKLWTKKDKDGKTTFDRINELGSKGWELVSVTPLVDSTGQTDQLLFSFKRSLLVPRQTSTDEAIQRAGYPPET